MHSSNIQYGQLTEVSQRAVDDLNGLIEQLSRTPRKMDMQYLERVLAAPGALVVAWDEGRIVGCAQLSILIIITKVKGWIDEVVVDEGYRGQGVAKRLVEMSTEIARSAGCKHVSLISGVDRSSAHSMYEKLGFYPRQSSQFRLDLE